MISIRIPTGSIEYVHATVTVTDDDDPGGTVLAGLTAVDLAITDTGDHTWIPAGWTGVPTSRALPGGDLVWDRPCRTAAVVDFDDVNYPQATYTLYVRPAAPPESPIIQAGLIVVA